MTAETCGSWRVLRIIEGLEAEKVWCSRTDGPCPLIGTIRAADSERRCATEPGTVLRVRWADECIDEAYYNLYMRGVSDAPKVTEENLDVAVDALRTCGAKQVSDGNGPRRPPIIEESERA